MATTDDNRPILPMDVGLRVDILDGEGIWNTGRIVDINREEEDMVEIKYDGWGDEYNEWIPLSMKRIAPLHMYTMVKKCWAKLNKWPWWPAFVVLRAPSTKSAADALEEETKVYVEFFDSYDEEKRSRCWMQKKAIASFQEGFDERAAKNFGKSFPQYVEGTQRAMAGGSPVLFTGHGTLPIEFSSKFSIPLEQHKAALVDSEKKWYEAYRIFSDRYKLLYGIEYAPQATAEVLAQHAKKAAGVKGRGKSAAAAVEEEEDGSSDDVEIIEQKMPLPAKRGNRTTPSTGALPVKRGRGRPPKHAKATPPTTEEESDDEKIEPASEVDDDVHEEEEEEDDDEANGLKCGRRVIAKKRKTETPPRNTRSRRTPGSH